MGSREEAYHPAGMLGGASGSMHCSSVLQPSSRPACSSVGGS